MRLGIKDKYTCYMNSAFYQAVSQTCGFCLIILCLVRPQHCAMSLRRWEQEAAFPSRGSWHSALQCGESGALGGPGTLWTGTSSAGANAAAAASTAWTGGRKPSCLCVPHWACLLCRWSDFPQAGAHPLQPLWVRPQVQRSVERRATQLGGASTRSVLRIFPSPPPYCCILITFHCFASAVHSAKQVHSCGCHRGGEATVLCWHVSLVFFINIQLLFAWPGTPD